MQELLRQAQRINIHDAPRITGILIRIVTELVCTEAILKNVVPGAEKDSLTMKIKKCLTTLDPGIVKPAKRMKILEMAWIRSQDQDGMFVQSLNAYVHNQQGNPTEGDVRAISGCFRPLLEQLDELMK